MKRILTFVLAFVFLLSAARLDAQVTAANKFGWTQGAPSLADANGYEYRVYADSSTTGSVLSGVVCTGTASPFDCTAPIPAFTPGNHTAQLTAKNIAGESAKSDPLSFVFVVTPAKPLGFGIR